MSKILWLVGIVCAVWVIYDVWSVNKRLSSTDKLLWTIGALIFNILTAILYYFTQKKN